MLVLFLEPMVMIEDFSCYIDNFIAKVRNQSLSLQTALSISYQTFEEVFKSDSWNTNFEVNLLVLLCLLLSVEIVILIFSWRKYSKPILEGKRLSQLEDQGELAFLSLFSWCLESHK